MLVGVALALFFSLASLGWYGLHLLKAIRFVKPSL